MLHHPAMGCLPYRLNHFAAKRRAAIALHVLFILVVHQYLTDIANRDAAALTRQQVATARATHAAQHAAANQALHELLQIAWRQALAASNITAADGAAASVVSDIEYRLYRVV